MTKNRKTWLAAACAVLALGAADDKGKKPKLDMKATPRMAFSPVNVYVTAEFVGGDDIEAFYCPEIEWEWGDGGKSIHEADCPPYEQGAKIERRFTAEHEFRHAGVYNVKATFRRTGNSFAANSVRVTVREGLGDETRDQQQ
jgi:hypothetical protein